MGFEIEMLSEGLYADAMSSFCLVCRAITRSGPRRPCLGLWHFRLEFVSCTVVLPCKFAWLRRGFARLTYVHLQWSMDIILEFRDVQAPKSLVASKVVCKRLEGTAWGEGVSLKKYETSCILQATVDTTALRGLGSLFTIRCCTMHLVLGRAASAVGELQLLQVLTCPMFKCAPCSRPSDETAFLSFRLLRPRA